MEEETEDDQAPATAHDVEDGIVGSENAPSTSVTGAITERTPLIKRDASKTSLRRKPRRMSSAAGEPHGDATVTQAVLMVMFNISY